MTTPGGGAPLRVGEPPARPRRLPPPPPLGGAIATPPPPPGPELHAHLRRHGVNIRDAPDPIGAEELRGRPLFGGARVHPVGHSVVRLFEVYQRCQPAR